MTITLTPVNTTTGHWQDLYNLTNAIVTAFAQNVVTADASANGSSTVGNTFISGTVGIVTLGVGTLRGGNVQSSGTLTLGSNVSLNTAFSFISGNAIVNSTTISVGNVVVNTSSIKIDDTVYTSIDLTTNTLSASIIDIIAMNTARSAEYNLSLTDNNANNFQVSKLILIHNGGSGFITEFGAIQTNTVNMGTFSASTNATHLILNYLPSSNNMAIKGWRMSTLI